MSRASTSTPLLTPARTQTADGKTRRVGVEIELSGMTFDELVGHVSDFFNADAREESRYVHVVDAEQGPFKVELDSDPIKDLEFDTGELPDMLSDVANVALDLVDAAAERVVPLEIVGPPLALDALPEIEALCNRLRERGAKGSRHALHYAFGLQLNPELPNLEADTLLGYLRAFSLCYDWLKTRQQLDISRKFTTYIGPWPDEYVRLINAADYQPDLDQLIDDYLKHNPTRNRALDMMPLFAHLDEDRVRQVVDDPRIKPRPTLHYRLPDCDIDNPGWSFSHVWNDWVRVDDLAADRERLAAMADGWRSHHEGRLAKLVTRWEQETASWLNPPTGS
ncbi:amidoligase family protein [Isoalcanivorax indicus]|uniref:amidoligase family protein n=1 Tax=Isoalcanivorax indicus TaxID=2202653 RepID=UPI0013C510A1|nr:amidoligase family protein [Isoalcanivorax indicus]